MNFRLTSVAQKRLCLSSLILSSVHGSLVRPHMNGLLPFERTIEQTTESATSPKTITAATMIKQ